MTTRNEHLQWCKERALQYVDRGELLQALKSFESDIHKWDGELFSPLESLSLFKGFTFVFDGDAVGMRRFIEGMQ